jgi:hypothetical protein
VQLVVSNWAAAPLLVVQLTLPVGVVAEGPLPSVMVTVHVAGALIASGFGVQATLVVVTRTASRLTEPWLAAWLASPP